MKATDLLKKDHATVKKLFAEFGRTSARATKARQQLAEKITKELEVHAQIEEEIFYPAVREVEGAEDLVQEAEQEHSEAKELIAEIQGMESSDEELGDKVTELKKVILHHATEEETEMFPKAESLGLEELERLGGELESRKAELAGTPAAKGRPSKPSRTGKGRSTGRSSKKSSRRAA